MLFTLAISTIMSSSTLELLLLPLFLILYLVNQYFGKFRPLNTIPNAHPIAPFTSLWLLSIRYRKRENRTVWESHKRLGPVIRLAPGEVSVCTLDGVKTIYKKWEKNRWYDAFINYETPPLVSEIQSAPHAARKRHLANIYSKSYIQNSSDIAIFNSNILATKVLPKIAASAAVGASIDVMRFNTAFSMDAMSAYALGSAYGTNFLDEVASSNRFFTAYAAVRNGFFWEARVPNLARILRRIGISLAPAEAMNGHAEIEDMCWKMCSRVETAIATNSLEPTGTTPVVYAKLSSALAKSINNAPPSTPTNPPDFLRKSVASEILDHLIAGHETSGITLTYTMYELSRNPNFQAALRAELRSINPPLTFPPPDSGPSAFSTSGSILPVNLFRTLDSLPLLNAALYETLRLYSPAAAGLPRVVPREGANLCGFMLPEGVVAHVSPYSLHRNEEVFRRAEEWIPERWMGDQQKEVKEWFWAFASGSRVCIGRWFAVQEMLLFLASVYTNFSSHIVDDEGIEPVDEFIAGPRSGKLILRFEHVKS